jgi:hypothetical protein
MRVAADFAEKEVYETVASSIKKHVSLLEGIKIDKK